MAQTKKHPWKAELHHWWPRTLSRHWADGDGRVHMLAPGGKVVRSRPAQFGAIRNDNNVKLADDPSPWDESFEHTFGPPDGLITPTLDWLRQATSPVQSSADLEFAARLTPLIVTAAQFRALTSILASLIIRSPGFRFRVESGTRALRARLGIPDGQGDRALVGLNVRGGQAMLSRTMERGKFAVLLSGAREFIFGDGFLHNIHQVSDPPHWPRCLVPLTPEICVFYASPSSYRSYPRAFVMNLTDDEVAFVNRSVQVYSRRALFYRSQPPEIEESFTRGEHLQWQYDRVDWTQHLEAIMSEAFFGHDAMFHSTDD